MLDFAIEIGMLLVVGAIGLFIIGFVTPKALIWGGTATLLVFVMAPVVDGFTGTEVLTELVPHFQTLASAYPIGVGRAFTEATSYSNILHNVVGGATVIVTALVLLPFYVGGIFLGLVWWPELILFRLIL